MEVKYNKTIYYWVECPTCGSKTEIDNEHGMYLTGIKIDCENCEEELEIIGLGETIYN